MTTQQSSDENFVLEVKNRLLKMEKNSIQLRCSALEETIKKSASLAIAALCNISPTFKINFHSDFQFKTNIEKHVNFIEEWKGIKERKTAKKNARTDCIIADKESYMRKATNWLNGKKAPIYSQTLFPQMIECIQEYSHEVSKNITFVISNEIDNERLQSKCQEYLAHLFVQETLKTKLSLNDKTKKTYLICSNSLKKNKTFLLPYVSDLNFDSIQNAIYFVEKATAKKLQEFKKEFYQLQNKNCNLNRNPNLAKNSGLCSNNYNNVCYENSIFQNCNCVNGCNNYPDMRNVPPANFYFGPTCCCKNGMNRYNCNDFINRNVDSPFTMNTMASVTNCNFPCNNTVCYCNNFQHDAHNEHGTKISNDVVLHTKNRDNDVSHFHNNHFNEMNFNHNQFDFSGSTIYNDCQVYDYRKQMDADAMSSWTLMNSGNNNLFYNKSQKDSSNTISDREIDIEMISRNNNWIPNHCDVNHPNCVSLNGENRNNISIFEMDSFHFHDQNALANNDDCCFDDTSCFGHSFAQ